MMTAVRREEDGEVGRDAAGSGASPVRQEVSGGDSGGQVERDVRWKSGRMMQKSWEATAARKEAERRNVGVRAG